MTSFALVIFLEVSWGGFFIDFIFYCVLCAVFSKVPVDSLSACFILDVSVSDTQHWFRIQSIPFLVSSSVFLDASSNLIGVASHPTFSYIVIDIDVIFIHFYSFLLHVLLVLCIVFPILTGVASTIARSAATENVKVLSCSGVVRLILVSILVVLFDEMM